MKWYRTREAFRDALPGHLEKRSSELGLPVELLRRRLVFQRFLARVLQVAPGHWVLSGGTALDWRLAYSHAQRTRSTVDLDFVCRVTLEQAREELASATVLDLGDYFRFALDPAARVTETEGRSFRFHITASLGPRPYLMFLVDIGLVDPLRWAPDQIVVADPFGDLGFGPLTVPMLPIPHQIAEKVHAITRLTREGRPRTRVVQDVADLVLIALTERPAARELRTALTAVFAAYDTHPLPLTMPATPKEWARDYRTAAEELRIPPDLDTADALVGEFLNGILQDAVRGVWDPGARKWRGS